MRGINTQFTRLTIFPVLADVISNGGHFSPRFRPALISVIPASCVFVALGDEDTMGYLQSRHLLSAGEMLLG